MNIADEINEVIRKIKTNGDSHQIVLERTFDTDATDLWNACTVPKRLSRWFEPVSSDLALGSRYTLATSGTEGDILECEPAKHLAITWEYQGSVSRVDIDLVAATSERTVLRVTHHVPSDDHWQTYGPAAAGVGWEESLRALSMYFGGDPRCAPDEMQEFASTTEGRELTRRGADAWAEVDQEAGTPASDAKARATRTADSYLGNGTSDQGSQ